MKSEQHNEEPLQQIDYDGPEHPDDLIPITTNEKPYTVILFDPASAFAGSSAVQATSHVIVHASTPKDAGTAAIAAAQHAGRGTSWQYPEILFLTEGYHEDLGPGALRQVK